MGIIYLITSPSGKYYIGQTIKTANQRWKEHIEDALNPKKNNCKALNAAIIKYGKDSFNITTLIECCNELLNEKEQEYILLYNSIIPNGYNIKLGGSSGLHHESTKNKISESLKGREVSQITKQKMIDTKNKELPMYLIELKKDDCIIGYRICNHPMGPEKRFFNSKITLEQNYNKAIEYLELLNNLDTQLISPKSSLPKYIRSNPRGYHVAYPNTKVKWFVSSTLSNDEKLNLAKEYLNNLLRHH